MLPVTKKQRPRAPGSQPRPLKKEIGPLRATARHNFADTPGWDGPSQERRSATSTPVHSPLAFPSVLVCASVQHPYPCQSRFPAQRDGRAGTPVPCFFFFFSPLCEFALFLRIEPPGGWGPGALGRGGLCGLRAASFADRVLVVILPSLYSSRAGSPAIPPFWVPDGL